MYKNLLLIIGLTLAPILCVSQNKTFKNEFNLNVTGFVANYFSLGGGPVSNNPYLFGFKRIFNEKSALRAGGNFNSSQSNILVNPQQPRSYQESKNVDFRIGYEWRRPVTNRFSWFYGIDLITNYNVFRNTNTQLFFDGRNQVPVDNETSNSSTGYGGGPIAGLQWNLSKRISLFAESRANFIYRENHRKTNWEGVTDALRQRNPNSFDERDNRDYFSSFNIFLPLDLFLAIKF